ncbi:MAG: phosphotransferase [Gemmatimonadetes bacterium]|jgi:Ser/Thr protein kinase RdoA (MazF antagonist)|nr:phosphotransferase [Gemmatimonadota bacterium]
MIEGTFSHSQIADALSSYGIEANAIDLMARSTTFAEVYRVRSNGGDWVARVRSPEARPEDVRFAAFWGQIIAAEVPVPVPVAPLETVPCINHRVVDVAPYIEHHAGDDDVGPDAWVQVGRWVGQMHRLGLPLAADAPRDLDYGNHPHPKLFRRYLDQARASMPDAHRAILQRVDRLVDKITTHTSSYLDGLVVGVVHGDMHFWNVLYKDKQPVAIIDLDFLQRGILIHDLAYAYIWLAAWESRRGGAWEGIGKRYVEAYETGRGQPLTDEEWICLPYFRIHIHLHFVLDKLRISWNRLAEAEEDLVEAEEVERTLGL